MILALLAAFSAADPAAFAVVEKPGGQVSFYTSQGKRVSGVAVGRYPHEIVRSPDGNLAYVSDNGILWMTEAGEGGNTISILDLRKRTKVGEISLGAYRRPHGMDIDPQTNRMVVTIENPHGLLLVDLASRKVLRKYDTGGAAPHMVLLSPDRRHAYVSNTGSNTIGIVHLESGQVNTIAAGGRPQGAALSRDGALAFITNSDGNSISILDTRSQRMTGAIPVGKGPGRIAVAPDGNTLVYNLQAGQAVGFADAAARKQTAVLPIGGSPLSLTLSRDGALAYAGIQDQDKVVVISVRDRRIAYTFSTPKGAGPDPILPLN